MAKISSALRLTESEIAALMRSKTRLRIATIGPGTEINLTPMTFGWANGLVYIFGRGQKVINIRRDPTSTILVDVGTRWTELQGIMMRGQAKILEDIEAENSDEWLQEAQLNLGVKHKLEKDGVAQLYTATASGRSRRWLVFTPASVVSWDNGKLKNHSSE